MKTLTSLISATFALLAINGCKASTDPDGTSAEAAVDSTDSTQAESTLLASAVDGSEAATANVTSNAAPSAQAVADFIAQHAAARYAPAACATVTENGLTVSLVFAGCTGPRGLRELNGELDLTISAGAAGAIDIAAAATNLQVGQATIDIASSAVYTVSGSTKSLAVMTQGTGTGPLGNAITHDGSYTATWDDSCVTVDGNWSTEVGDASRSTTASVMRCEDQCPSGTITRDTILNRTITITFDGSATGSWSTSAGRSGTFPLPCGL